MRFLRLLIAYDGTAFAGWQIQPRDLTIQQLLQEAWQNVTGESLGIVASGRTDAGVHALGQVCSLTSETKLSGGQLGRALNSYLPQDIRVLGVEEAPEGFHAIRDAVAKTYRYQIQCGPEPNVFLRRHYWYVRGTLDVAAMREAGQSLVGEHDFASFQAVGAERKSSVRTVHRLEFLETQSDGYEQLWIQITANGFLYNMVRNIVGSLVLVGRHRKPASWLNQVLAARDRRMAGPTAPARGLVLLDVEYPF